MVFLLFFVAVQSSGSRSLSAENGLPPEPQSISGQQNQFTFTPLCLQAAKQISLLRLKPAAELLQLERAHHPNNCAVDYLENYIDFYSLITNQDIAELRRLEKNKSLRIARLGNIPSSSPYKLYAQAEINLQWAFSRVFQQEFFTAALEFRDCYKLLEENAKTFPAFTPNQKDLGMLKAMLGKQGLAMLKTYVEQDKHPLEQLLEKQSGEYYYTFIQLNFGDKQECWHFCEKVTPDYETNLLSAYLRMFTAIKTGHGEIALQTFDAKPTGSEYSVFPILDYLAGVAYLNKLDDEAAIYFKKYVSFSKGKNLIKDAYKRLSWYYLVKGEEKYVELYRNMVIRYGAAIAEEDKQALREAEAHQVYHPGLLKARLLFDGGYYDKALQQLQQTTVSGFAEKIEMAYRYGRVYHEMKHYSKAIEYYESCVQLGGSSAHLYFVPVSCNQLGAICERLGNKTQAIYWYEKTLTYKGYDYKGSTTQKAKTALARLQVDAD